MFGRYPDRRLTLWDVLRVRAQRTLVLIPLIVALELTGVLPDLRAFVQARGPELGAQLRALSARPAAPEGPTPSRGCVRRVDGTGIVLHSPGACDG